MKETISYNISQINEICEKISHRISDQTIILLNGDLGSGKTTFSRNLLEHIFSIENVTSPTFNLINEYLCDYKMKQLQVLHCDFYRITGQVPDDLWHLDENFLVLVEWPNKVTTNWQEFCLNHNAVLITIDFKQYNPNSNQRDIIINYAK